MNGDVVFVGSKKANCHSERMVDGTQVAIDLRVCVIAGFCLFEHQGLP